VFFLQPKHFWLFTDTGDALLRLTLGFDALKDMKNDLGFGIEKKSYVRLCRH